MTPSELLEVSQLNYANGIGSYTIFLTISGGYIVAAYLAGKDLTRSQYVIANSLFLVLATSSILSMTGFFLTAVRHSDRAVRLDPELVVLGNPYMIVAVTLINLFVVLACLKFMRDVRTSNVD